MKNMLRGLLVPLVLVIAIGCSSAQLASLAKDEAIALSIAESLDTLLTSGAALADIKAVSTNLLAVDPASPTLQRLDATVQSAQTAQDIHNATLANKGVIVLLKTGKAITQAAAGN